MIRSFSTVPGYVKDKSCDVPDSAWPQCKYKLARTYMLRFRLPYLPDQDLEALTRALFLSRAHVMAEGG